MTIELVNDAKVKANITAIVSNLEIGEYWKDQIIEGLTSIYIIKWKIWSYGWFKNTCIR
jgi:hypothetical protein